MRRAVILIDQDFQDAEVIYPYYRLIEGGFDLDIAAENARQEYHGKYGYSFFSDVSVAEISVDAYDIFIIPGGGAPGHMRTKPVYVNIVKEAFAKNKIVGSICHGAQLLVAADVLKDRKLTCYIDVRQHVINAGAEFIDQEVVRDGNLITSRKPADLPAFMKTIIQIAQ